jgi:hypothetical protein
VSAPSGNADGLRVPWPVVWGLSVVAALAIGYFARGSRESPEAPTPTVAAAPGPASAATPAAPVAPGPARLPVKPPESRAQSMPESLQQRDPEALRQRTEQMRADLEAEFAREPESAAWSAAAEADLVHAASSDDAVATGETPVGFEAVCRSKTCRVTATFDEDGDAESWAGGYLLGNGGKRLSVARVMTRRLPDGRVELTIYGTGD